MLKTFVPMMFMAVGVLAATYTTNSYTTDPSLQAELVAYTTTYYDTKISQSGYFPNTITINVLSKKPVAPPPPPPSQGSVTTQDLLNTIVTISTETYAYGFASGMETERCLNIKQLMATWSDEMVNGTCAGQELIPSMSTNTYQNICAQVYQVAISTISQKFGNIYNLNGACVAP